MLPGTLYGPKGQFDTFAMLDTGSTCRLILSTVADKLGLDGPPEHITLNGLQNVTELSTKRVDVSISPTGNRGIRYDVNGVDFVVDCLNVSERKVNLGELKSMWSHLRDLEISDMDGSQVTLLIGSDVAELIVPLEVRSGNTGQPIAVRTMLGWTVTGKLPGYLSDGESIYKVHISSTDEELQESVKSWWRTEDFGCKYDSEVRRSVEDKRTVKFLDEETKRVDGRYEVPLLWKDRNDALPNNRVVAEHRLNLLERRLQRDTELANRYKKTIENDAAKGYIKKLTETELDIPVKQQWYLLHHPVLNVNKPGKVRRVFDAASVYRGSSLNDHLIASPDL